MPPLLPRRDRWVRALPSSPTTAAFPVGKPGRLPHCAFRGLLSVHCAFRPAYSRSRLATLYTGGFGDVVAYVAAPVATDWINPCRVGLSPTGDPRLCTAHSPICVYCKIVLIRHLLTTEVSDFPATSLPSECLPDSQKRRTWQTGGSRYISIARY